MDIVAGRTVPKHCGVGRRSPSVAVTVPGAGRVHARSVVTVSAKLVCSQCNQSSAGRAVQIDLLEQVGRARLPAGDAHAALDAAERGVATTGSTKGCGGSRLKQRECLASAKLSLDDTRTCAFSVG